MSGDISQELDSPRKLSYFIAQSLVDRVVGLRFPAPGQGWLDEPEALKGQGGIEERLAEKSKTELQYLAGMRCLAARYPMRGISLLRAAVTSSYTLEKNYRVEPDVRHRAPIIRAESNEAIGAAYFASEDPEHARRALDPLQMSIEGWDKLERPDEGARARCRLGMALLRAPAESTFEEQRMRVRAARLLDEARELVDPDGSVSRSRSSARAEPKESHGYLFSLEASLLNIDQPSRAGLYWARAARAFEAIEMPKAAAQARSGLTASSTRAAEMATVQRQSIGNWLSL